MIFMKNGKSLLLELTGEMPLFKIINFLIENKGIDFTKKDMVEGTGISRAALFKYWPELERHNIVKATRKFGKTTLYTLNSESLVVKKILDLEKVLIATAMQNANKGMLIPV